MAEAPAHIAKIAHPAPHRERVALAELAFALAAAPAAWAIQLVVGYGLTSHVCFSGSAPDVSSFAGGGAIALQLVIELIALLVAASSAVIAWRLWRTTRQEVEGNAVEMVEAGKGRTRFLALWGLMTSVGFLGAIAFSLVGLLVVPLCGY
jgi:hypothetical protein